MALTLLANEWVKTNGGKVTALTVDHGIRETAAEEAGQVRSWLMTRGIVHKTLKWRGGIPTKGIQNAARCARYSLLDDWCGTNSVLHLLVGHTLNDQAETLVMRLQRGSGPDGLAAMSAVRELNSCRILRPILGSDRGNLRAYLRGYKQKWLVDPSNIDPRFARSQLRKAGKLDCNDLAIAARHYGLARQSRDKATNRMLARFCQINAHGYVRFDCHDFLAAPKEISIRALGRVIAAVGGRDYVPRQNPLQSMLGKLKLQNFNGSSLGRCVVLKKKMAKQLFTGRVAISLYPLNLNLRVSFIGMVVSKLHSQHGLVFPPAACI